MRGSAAQVEVLRGVDLDIPPGAVVALVGSSGSGKSSTIKLLERLYPPSSGAILLDGRPLPAYDDAWLHRHMALVGQARLPRPCAVHVGHLRRMKADRVRSILACKRGDW